MLDAGENAPGPKKPDLPGTVVVRPAMEELTDSVLADMMLQAQTCVRAFGDFHLAIAASEHVEPLLVRLMLDPAYRSLPWKRTHLWSIDDCVVDIDDDRSRAKRIREILVDHSDIPVDQVHGIMVAADDPGGEYQSELRESLGWREKGQDRLDFALLSLLGGGPAAHSLQGRPVEGGSADLVLRRAWTDTAGLAWYGLTPRMISATRFIAVVAAGEPARRPLWGVTEARAAGATPLIKPIGGEMRWYLDAAACDVDPAGSSNGRDRA